MVGRAIVPGFDSIIGQRFTIGLLQAFLRKGTVPHALLFTGMAGVGKRTTAKTFAMALNCRGADALSVGENDPAAATAKPCGRCRTCRQILNGSHPDVIVIEPQAGILRIDQVRKLLGTLALKPFSARQRVVIIADAQTMNAEAGNALLKVLEEPPADTKLILTALQKSDLLPTIVSRCRHARFNPLSVQAMETLLADVQGLDGQQAATIAELAGGSFSKAQRLLEARWQTERDWLIRAAGLDQPAGLPQRSMTVALAFAAQLSQRKDQIQDLLDMLKAWIRDLSIWPYGPQYIVNRDCLTLLAQSRSQISDQKLLDLWDCVAAAQKDIAANANLRLTLDVMALRMAGRAST
jgi:DNA polymerase III subunit delta'